MKPYITDSLENGRHILPMQFEGMSRTDLNSLQGMAVIAYSIPESQSLTATWQLRLHFDNDTILEFSSACTEVDGWQEIGSLNVRKVSSEPADKVFHRTVVNSFKVCRVERLIHEDPIVFAEAGLVFIESNQTEIIIAAGVSPGSVSVLAPFSAQAFEPELSAPDYKRQPIQA